MLESISNNKVPSKNFEQDTPEDELVKFIELVKTSVDKRDSLVNLLAEELPLYTNKSTNETTRIRGYILATFEQVGLPETALPYVLEELESGKHAYLVAAAAKALRGLESPTTKIIPFLFKAIDNIKYTDDTLTFDSYKPKWPFTNPTTALKEIFKTFAWLGANAKVALTDLETLYEDHYNQFSSAIKIEIKNAIEQIKLADKVLDTDCCAIPKSLNLFAKNYESQNVSSIDELIFEDQDNNTLKYKDFFTQSPTIVVFFYSRCDNPNKCSLTITKLAKLQKEIKKEGLSEKLKTVAITYDPDYDLPQRLKAYGKNRNILFDNNNRILRPQAEIKQLQNYFHLGVNFINKIVNRHRIELFILDDKGKVAFTFTRLQWETQEVLDKAKDLLNIKSSNQFDNKIKENFFIQPLLNNLISLIPSILVAFFPKCPMCWAAYLSLLGITSLQSLPYSPWLLPIFIILMLFNLLLVFKRAKQLNRMKPFYLSTIGATSIIILGIIGKITYALYFGIALSFLGSLLNSLPVKNASMKS